MEMTKIERIYKNLESSFNPKAKIFKAEIFTAAMLDLNEYVRKCRLENLPKKKTCNKK